MEFALLDRHIAKQKQYQSSLEKTLELTTIIDPENKEEILRLNDEIIKSEIEQRNILRDSIAEFSKQLDLLPVGSSEWNILNDKVKEYEINLMDANIAIEKAIIQKYDTEFALLDKKINKENQIQNSYKEQINILKELNTNNYDGFIQYDELILESENRKLDLLKQSSQKLKEQLSLLETNSQEWHIIAERLENVESSIRQTTLEIIKQNKEILRNKFDRELEKIEKSLFDGKTQERAREELEKEIKLQDKYVSGLEKELLVENILIDARKNGIKLTQEELNLLNQSDKIERNKLEGLEKQLNIRKLEQKLVNLQNQETERQLQKMTDGTWDFVYVADQKAIDETNKELKNAKIDLIKWERDFDNKVRREELDSKSKYLDRLNEITQKALDSEYESYEDFQQDLKELNNDFMLNDFAMDIDSNWKDIIDIVDGNLDFMLNSYKDYLSDIKEIADEILDQQRRVSIGQVTKSEPVLSIKDSNENYTQFDDSYYTDPHKTWVVKFNKDIDPSTASNVKVVDKDGKIISIGQVSASGDSIELQAPSGGYDSGAYAVIITKGIQSLSGIKLKEEVLKNFTVGFNTGGYTGSWGKDGKLAFLHEKELVLNKIDTSNLLKAINVTRDLFNNFKLPQFPQFQPATIGGGNQVFHINKLEFPNARDSKEIEGAIKNLSTYATQWANRN